MNQIISASFYIFRFLAFIFILVICTSTKAQTNVSGNINTNTTWTKAGSPYYLTNNILVEIGATLTIEPGVVVEAKGRVSLSVLGSIIAVGNQVDSIYFKGNGTKGYWSGIKIRNTGGSILNTDFAYVSGSKFSFVSVSDAYNAIYQFNCSLFISNSAFINNTIGVQHRSSSKTLITKSKFFNNLKGSYIFSINEILAQGTDNPLDIASSISDLKYDSCDFYNNNLGISLDYQNAGNFDGFSLTNCFFKYNHFGIVVGNEYRIDFNNSSFLNNKFIENTIGINFSRLGSGVNNHLISSNLFYKNLTGLDFNSSDGGKIAMQKNIFLKNEFGTKISRSYSSLISNSSFIDNKSSIIIDPTCMGLDEFNCFFSDRSRISTDAFIKFNFLSNSKIYSIKSNNYFNISIPILKSTVSTGAILFDGNYIENPKNYPINQLVNVLDSFNSPVIISSSSISPIIGAPISMVKNVKKYLSSGRVVISWIGNPESDISGYKVYYGGFTEYSYTTSVDVGNVLIYTLPAGVGIDEDIAVTAYDASKDGIDDQFDGNESWYSPANIAPNSPTELNVDAGPRTVKLSWTGVANANSYNIYRSTDSSTFNKIGSSVNTSYVDTGLIAFQKYFYKIAAFDSLDLSYSDYGLESGFSSVKSAVSNNIFYLDPVTGRNSNIGSISNPLSNIQSALNKAQAGDTVLLLPGLYNERVLISKSIIVGSRYLLNNNDTAASKSTIIDGQRMGIVIRTESASVKLVGFTVRNGFSTVGAGIYSGGAIEMRHMIISDCVSQGDIDGGGAYITGKALIYDSEFLRNSGRKGGALVLNAITNDTLKVIRTLFKNNLGGENGSAIILFGGFNSNVLINNCLFISNTGASPIHSQGSISTNTFINHCNFINNNSASIFMASGNVIIRNSILRNNASSEVASSIGPNTGPVTITYSNVKGGYSGTGNINADPLFADTNYIRILNNSTCIGAGDSTISIDDDFFQGPRPNPAGSRPDIGAFESKSKFPSPTLLALEPSSKKVILSWSQTPTSIIAGYKIYRSQSSISDDSTLQPLVIINGAQNTSFVDTNSISNNTNYFYRIRSFDSNNFESGYSNQLSGRPDFVQVPKGLKLNNSPASARISWDTLGITGGIRYRLYRGRDTLQSSVLLNMFSGSVFTDTTLVRDTSYFYSIRAINSTGAISEYSPFIPLIPTRQWHVDSARGNNEYGNGSFEFPYRAISNAIQRTVTLDSIIIGRGTYTDNISIKDKKLFLIGLHGPFQTLLRPSIQSSILYLEKADTSLIKGITLFNASERVAGSAILSRQSFPTFEDIVFRNNWGADGIIMTMAGSFIMKNCLAYDNNANSFFNLSNSVDYTAQVNHLTYMNNIGHLFIAILPTYRVKFKNSIIWSNASIPYSGVIEVENSIFKGGFSNGINVIDTIPNFVDVSSNNFKLLNNSAAIGLGDSTVAVKKDIEGFARSRPISSKPDAGAFESPYGHPSPKLVGYSSLLGNIRLQWNQYPKLTVDKIFVYKGFDSVNLIKYDSTLLINSYRDSLNNSFNRVLFYKVSSTGNGLQESGLSNIVRTISFTPPQLLNNVLGPQDSSVLFNWRKVNNALKYNLQISLDSSFRQRDSVTVTDTSFTLNGLLTNSNYYWRVQTSDSIHNSAWSNFTSFRTRLKQPIITIVKPGNKVDSIFWSANKNINVKRYNIYRDTTINPTLLLDSVSANTFSYIDTIGLRLNVKYYYRIAAVDSLNFVGPFSKSDSAVPFNRRPIAVRLSDRNFNNAGKFNTVRTVYSALGSVDLDGRIVSYNWYVNDSLVNDKDSVLIHYYRQGQNKVRLLITDNDGAIANSEASVNITSFIKKYNAGFLAGITALDGNNLFVADSSYDPINGASVQKIDSNGNTKFRLIVSSKIFTTPSVSSDSLLFITNGSSINGFNSNGAPLWPTISLGGLTYVTPTIDSMMQALYIGVSNSNFFAIDYKTGKVQWNTICDAPINSSAIVTGDRKLIFASNNGTLYGFDLTKNINTNPIPKWKRTFVDKLANSPAVDSLNQIYFGTINGKLIKINLDTSGNVNVLWSLMLDASIQSSPVIDAAGFVYIGTTSGKFFKINPTTGSIIWTYNSLGAIKSTPSISDFGSIYVADMTGLVTSLSPDGKVNWTYKDSASIVSNILYINNTIYIGSQSGNLVGIFDNPSTNTVNTSLGFNFSPLNHSTGSLAKISKISIKNKMDKILDFLAGPPPPPTEVSFKTPAWGTFQGNSRRTGSKNILCPDIPVINIPNCTNFADSFRISTSNMLNKYWVINQKILTGTTDTSVTIKSTDTYQLVAFNNLGCSKASLAPVLIKNSDISKPSVMTNKVANRFCTNDSIRLTASVAGERYQWNILNFPISGEIFSSMTTSLPGSYSVTVFNKFGCKATSDILLVQTQRAPETPTITFKNSTVFCQGSTDTLFSSTSSGNQWHLNGIAINGATASNLIVNSTGIYTVVTSSNGCSSSPSNGIPIVVNPLPTKPNIAWDGSQLSTNATTVFFQWLLNNSMINGANSATYRPTTNGIYRIQVTDLRGCKNVSDSFNIIITSISGLNSIPSGNIVNLYPNPAREEVLLKFNQQPSSILNCQMIDINGRPVKQFSIRNQITLVPLSDLAVGTYIIKISGKNYDQTKQLIISKK